MRRALAVACTAACALVAAAARAQPPLGRLFFTPQERARLHAAHGGDAVDAAPAGSVSGAPAPAVMAVSGIARNSRTGLVAWIDGQAVPSGGTYAGYHVHVGDAGVILRRAGEPDRWLPVARSVSVSKSATRVATEVVQGTP